MELGSVSLHHRRFLPHMHLSTSTSPSAVSEAHLSSSGKGRTHSTGSDFEMQHLIDTEDPYIFQQIRSARRLSWSLRIRQLTRKVLRYWNAFTCALLGVCTLLLVLTMWSWSSPASLSAEAVARYADLATCCPSQDGQRVTATRFWAATKKDLQRLDDFVHTAAVYSDCILVGVQVQADRAGTVQHLETLSAQSTAHVCPVPIFPWNSFSTALNSLLYQSSTVAATSILFQSIEVETSHDDVSVMRRYLQSHQDMLVVGAALPLDNGTMMHEFQEGQHVLTGLTSPWNTLSVWDVRSLALTGFLAIADGVAIEEKMIEEVPTTLLLQHLATQSGTRPIRNQSALLKLSDTVWHVDLSTPEKRAKHHKKMSTKNSRAEQQRIALHLPPGVVHHVIPVP